MRITAVDESCLPPLPSLVLEEISAVGVVAADARTQHFFPWHEIVEIRPGEDFAGLRETSEDGEVVEALLGVDSEP